MNSRLTFKEILRFGIPDRIPFLDEGLRDEVFQVWNASPRKFRKKHNIDVHKFLMPVIDPLPETNKWPSNQSELHSFKKYLNPDDPLRFGDEWRNDFIECEKNDIIRILRVHRGFFISMGVGDWQRFDDVINLLLEDTKLVQEFMQMYGEFVSEVLELALNKMDVDAVYFSEPIGGKDATLISPQMYHDIILKSYAPALHVLKKHNIDIIIFLSYSNIRHLIPMLLEAGFNCLWACETDSPDMDYREIRKEFGTDLSLISGINLDILKQNEVEMKQNLRKLILPVIADGGYIPLINARIRKNISYQKYVNYRRILSSILEDLSI
jgi:hypothetical protein